ncbi:hypothetical protein [Bartonella sp. WD16.2]|uniref:hypothetical protein n=1 Tax=Bartonella sp. WD16.2 TaxID=1933904 RepID=UPI00099A3264|nr:hypothetical protein [Bartonella sp. WD16.2]AQX20354.1 hypothetical protein BWD162_012620 [Bartonella sp. WD16.2]
MKIKQKILLFLSIMVLMVGTAFAGPYEFLEADFIEMGFINSVIANTKGVCRLSFIPKSKPDDYQVGEWSCDHSGGKNILDLAKTALTFKIPVMVGFKDNDIGGDIKRVLIISLQ